MNPVNPLYKYSTFFFYGHFSWAIGHSFYFRWPQDMFVESCNSLYLLQAISHSDVCILLIFALKALMFLTGICFMIISTRHRKLKVFAYCGQLVLIFKLLLWPSSLNICIYKAGTTKFAIDCKQGDGWIDRDWIINFCTPHIAYTYLIPSV